MVDFALDEFGLVGLGLSLALSLLLLHGREPATQQTRCPTLPNVPYGPAINWPIGVTALEMTLSGIVDSCLHHLHATLVWLRDGNWLFA